MSSNEPSLDSPCPYCGGTGEAPINPAAAAWAYVKRGEFNAEVEREKTKILAKRQRKWPRLRIVWE